MHRTFRVETYTIKYAGSKYEKVQNIISAGRLLCCDVWGYVCLNMIPIYFLNNYT